MPKLYRIRNWNKLYENSESKKIKNTRYVLVPNHHDGKGFRRLLTLPDNLPEHPDGIRIFSAWILILQIASKCAERGILADEDGPLTSEDMALKTGAPKEIFDGALSVLSSKDFRWIEAIDILERQDNLRERPDEPGDHPDRTELNGTERNGIKNRTETRAQENSQGHSQKSSVPDSVLEKDQKSNSEKPKTENCERSPSRNDQARGVGDDTPRQKESHHGHENAKFYYSRFTTLFKKCRWDSDEDFFAAISTVKKKCGTAPDPERFLALLWDKRDKAKNPAAMAIAAASNSNASMRAPTDVAISAVKKILYPPGERDKTTTHIRDGPDTKSSHEFKLARELFYRLSPEARERVYGGSVEAFMASAEYKELVCAKATA